MKTSKRVILLVVLVLLLCFESQAQSETVTVTSNIMTPVTSTGTSSIPATDIWYDFTGTPGSGWQSTAAAASGWNASVVSHWNGCPGGCVSCGGTTPLMWYAPGDAGTSTTSTSGTLMTDANLDNPVYFICHFPLNSNNITSFSLALNIDDGGDVWINGHQLNNLGVDLSTASPFDANSSVVTPLLSNLSLATIESYLQAGDNVIAIKAWNGLGNGSANVPENQCWWVGFSMTITDVGTTGAPCGSNGFWCVPENNGCTPNSTNSALISSSERVGQLKSGVWGDAGNYSGPNPNMWNALGSADVGPAPNNSDLFGLSVGNQSDKAFFGTRNHGKDLTDAVVAWGDNGPNNRNYDGSMDNLIFEFHAAAKCGVSAPTEIARMLPNGNVGIGTPTPVNILDVLGGVAVGGYAGNNVAPYHGMIVEGKVGVGTSAPIDNAKVDVLLVGATTFLGPEIGVNIHNEATKYQPRGSHLFPEAIGCNALSDNKKNASNYGVIGTGSNAPENFGVAGLANSTGVSQNTGLYGQANGAASNYGVWGVAPLVQPVNCAGYFDGDVLTTATQYYTSDEKLKTNVQPFKNSLDLLKQLNVKTYDFKYDEYKNSMNLPQTNQIGVIAQDLQTVFPNLVKEKLAPSHLDPNTNQPLGQDTKFLAVNYTGLIPVLIAAVNELNAKTDSISNSDSVSILKAALDNTNADLANTKVAMGNQIAALQQQLDDICNGGCAAFKGSSSDQSNQLLQNVPNPFSQQTTIGYVINVGTTAYMNINSLDGKLIKHVPLTVNGAGSITVASNEMAPGTYTYTLVVDAKVVDTKIMVITAQD